MMPAIAPGERVVVTCGVDPVVGDVVLFHFDDKIGVHRVAARAETWLVTWGDANALPDFPIMPAYVIGTVRNARPAPRSLYRVLLLRFLAPAAAPADRITRRVRLLYRIRSAWELGFLASAAKLLRGTRRRPSSEPNAVEHRRHADGC